MIGRYRVCDQAQEFGRSLHNNLCGGNKSNPLSVEGGFTMIGGDGSSNFTYLNGAEIRIIGDEYVEVRHRDKTSFREAESALKLVAESKGIPLVDFE